MVYSILVRWGPEWDSQSVIYTKSLALFELLRDSNGNKYYSEFSDELKAEIEERYDAFDRESPYAAGPLDNIDILEAIDWLEYSPKEYPILVLDHTEFTAHWNW